MQRLTLALDVMGGDFGPSVTVPAAVQALRLDPCLSIFLVGDETAIIPLLRGVSSIYSDRLQVVAAQSVIAGDARPSVAIRNSRGSSMRMALELVQQGQAQACVSAGNTGALMGLATLLLKPLDGIERPALMTVLQNQQQGKTVLLDLGANVQSDSRMLGQFAIMGAVMAEEMLRIPRPRVALLNIGEEENKGIDSIRQTAAWLKEREDIDYIGYLEANELLSGKADVLVCDGFIGNVAVKTMEGMMRLFLSLLHSSKPHRHRPWWSRYAMRWLQRQFFRQFSYLNPDQYNGACLLGLRGIVIKSHGAANTLAFGVAIGQAIQAIRRQLSSRIAMRLSMVLPKSD